MLELVNIKKELEDIYIQYNNTNDLFSKISYYVIKLKKQEYIFNTYFKFSDKGNNDLTVIIKYYKIIYNENTLTEYKFNLNKNTIRHSKLKKIL